MSTIDATSAGIFGSTVVIGDARFVAAVTSALVCASGWTFRPVNSRNRMAPIDQESVQASISDMDPMACSGLMYGGVPRTIPRVRVVSVVLGSRGVRRRSRGPSRPRSVVQHRLSGLRSRWMMPRSCACSSVSST